MRSLILAMVFGAAVHAQVPRGSPEPAKPGTGFPARPPSWKFFRDLKSLPAAPAAEPPGERISLKPGQACAIALLNVLRRDNVDPKMILPPGPPVDARIGIVAPPAPSCDDIK